VIEAAIALGAAFLGAAWVIEYLQSLMPRRFRRPPHVKMNYRGREVVATAGIALVPPLLIGAGLAMAGERRVVALAIGAAGTASAALGYLDDVYGSRHAGGFIGHLKELVHGRVTTGLLKAFGGGVIGVAAAWWVGSRGVWVLVAGGVVALSSNLANLLDVRPGRAIKVWTPCATALMLSGLPGHSERTLVCLGGGVLAFLYFELREQVMLGDTGAGLLGAALGVAAVASLGRPALLAVLAVLVVLTAASEKFSFTRVIDAVPPLRWADRLGRTG
jgi:UDP-N-acetylmuramyl pentapeptide phosphotransferase/UDP-N-acetylglucosamine-1-phosphate transferase